MRTDHMRPLAIAVVRASIRHRINGYSAEIAFFGLLSLVPTTITLGGVLHLLAKIGGPELATRGEQGATEAIRFLIGPKLADSVINPFVRTQLSQPGGLAITGLIVASWLMSKMFHTLVHAIDVTFDVVDRRPSRLERLISMLFAICAVGVVAVTLALMVLGWRNGRAGLDRFLARTPVIAQLWEVGRWPVLVAILLAIVVALYRFSPNVRHTWRHCLPGGVLAVALWIAAAVGFRAYLLIGAAAPTGVSTNDLRVELIGRAVGASIATAVWMYVSALAVLTGAELNGELRRRRVASGADDAEPARGAGEPVAIERQPAAAETTSDEVEKPVAVQAVRK